MSNSNVKRKRKATGVAKSTGSTLVAFSHAVRNARLLQPDRYGVPYAAKGQQGYVEGGAKLAQADVKKLIDSTQGDKKANLLAQIKGQKEELKKRGIKIPRNPEARTRTSGPRSKTSKTTKSTVKEVYRPKLTKNLRGDVREIRKDLMVLNKKLHNMKA